MKITVSTVCVAAVLAPLVATYAPVSLTTRHQQRPLYASAENVPDLVQAYQKAKPGPELLELSIKTPDVETPILSSPLKPPANVEISMPDLKVDLPDLSDAKASMTDSISNAATVVNTNFQGLNEYMKAAREQAAAQAAERAVVTAASSAKVPTLGKMLQSGGVSNRAGISIPEGKAPTLAEFLAGGKTSGASVAAGLADTKAKVLLLMDNSYSLVRGSVPDGMGKIELPGNVSPEMAAGVAAATVALLVLAGKNNQKKAANESAGIGTMSVDEIAIEESTPLSALAKDVKKMGEQIKLLSKETQGLRKELVQAEERLNQKELEISKERLKGADNELQLKREVEKVRTKLRESERRFQELEKEMASATGIPAPKTAPTPAPKTAPAASKPAPTPAPKTAPTPAPKTAPAASESPPAPAPKPTPVAPEPFFVQMEPAKKKAPVKKAPVKKAASTKKVAPPDKSAGPKGSAPKETTPKEATPKETAPKAKAAPKKTKVNAKKAVGDRDNWATLSGSTLSRKTVKELTGYLAEKGSKTTSDDGKVLKKALLVQAVQSL